MKKMKNAKYFKGNFGVGKVRRGTILVKWKIGQGGEVRPWASVEAIGGREDGRERSRASSAGPRALGGGGGAFPPRGGGLCTRPPHSAPSLTRRGAPAVARAPEVGGWVQCAPRLRASY